MALLHSPSFVNPDHDHQQCISSALAKAEQICLEQGQRFTAIRRKVFELIWQQHKPIGAYQILDELQQQTRTAPPTVYRALDFLLNLGLIHRISSLNAFIGCAHPGASHEGYFFICTSCRTCAELHTAAITCEINRSASECGFVVQDRLVEVMGLCPDCSAEVDVT
jgi:Fur family zinc uptake transcriptional regulator